MIIYFDTSALVKSYIQEKGTSQVRQWVSNCSMSGTSLISKAELASALSIAVRLNRLANAQAQAVWQEFRRDWMSLYKIEISESIVERAAAIVWDHRLRGYDAIHLSAAISWQEQLGESLTLATFDGELWQAARNAGLGVLPEGLEG